MSVLRAQLCATIVESDGDGEGDVVVRRRAHVLGVVDGSLNAATTQYMGSATRSGLSRTLSLSLSLSLSLQAPELDAKYGSKPDLVALPMYCVVAAFKDPYDTKDMRTTSNNDVAFAMDVPPSDSTIVAQLRAKGAIVYAKTVAHEFNWRSGRSRWRREATHEPAARRRADECLERTALQSL